MIIAVSLTVSPDERREALLRQHLGRRRLHGALLPSRTLTRVRGTHLGRLRLRRPCRGPAPGQCTQDLSGLRNHRRHGRHGLLALLLQHGPRGRLLQRRKRVHPSPAAAAALDWAPPACEAVHAQVRRKGAARRRHVPDAAAHLALEVEPRNLRGGCGGFGGGGGVPVAPLRAVVGHVRPPAGALELVVVLRRRRRRRAEPAALALLWVLLRHLAIITEAGGKGDYGGGAGG